MTSISSLYWSQTSPVDLCMQTACLPTELIVSMGPRPHLSICANKTACLAPKLQVSVGPRPHVCFCACKTACLDSELLVSICSSSHIWFLHANSYFRTRITSPYGSQTSPAIWCMQNGVISTRITSLYGSLSWAHEGFPSPSPLREAG